MELEAQVKILTGKATAAGTLASSVFESPLDKVQDTCALDPCSHGR